MAKTVGYFEDFETPEREAEAYSEGPFVVVDALGSGFRIECEMKESKCPVLPHYSIYRFAKSWHKDIHKKMNMDVMKEVCDWLNAAVANKAIVLCGKIWVAPEYNTL